MNLYVYYKVESSVRHLAKAEVDLILAFAARLQVRGSLMRRADHPDGLETWMEVYEDASDIFIDQLEAFAATTKLPSLATERHLESFVAW